MNLIKNEWEFLLKGNPMGLRHICHESVNMYFYVYETLNHYLDCSVDDFRMTSSFCDGEEDLRLIWQIGYELISLFNGAAILDSVDFRKIEIEKLLNKEREVKWFPKEETIGLLNKSGFVNTTAIPRDARLWLVDLATTNEDVYLILKYFEMDQGWQTYYKLMETLETFAKNESITLTATPEVRASFTNVANNYSLSGLSSRHGFKVQVKENKSEKMSLDEAHIFIRNMAKDYLKQKYTKKFFS